MGFNSGLKGLKRASYGNASAAALFSSNFPSDFDLMKK